MNPAEIPTPPAGLPSWAVGVMTILSALTVLLPYLLALIAQLKTAIKAMASGVEAANDPETKAQIKQAATAAGVERKIIAPAVASVERGKAEVVRASGEFKLVPGGAPRIVPPAPSSVDIMDASK